MLRCLLVLLMTISVSACTGNLRQELGAMALLHPTPDEIQTIRSIAHRYYTCPSDTTTVYVLAEVTLADNLATVGVRCQ